MTVLRGITWDHPRGIAPLRAVSGQWARAGGDQIEWFARSLGAFEDAPLIELAQKFDLLAIDHPSIGDAVRANALVALDEFLTPEELEDRARDSAGPSHASYQSEEHQWALAIDAACMVSAVRDDLTSGANIPARWSELPQFSADLGRDRVLIPANPTHFFCLFLSMCQSLWEEENLHESSANPPWWGAEGISVDIAEASFLMVKWVLTSCSPDSLASDPITVLNRLAGSDHVAYVPLTFGYVTYSLTEQGPNVVRFANAPSAGARPVGTLTGGVGLAVSSFSEAIPQAAQFARFVSERSVQAGVFSMAGGQPARESAWGDAQVNANSSQFFAGTLQTMELSFLRPRSVGYPKFQSAAAQFLHSAYLNGTSEHQVARSLRSLWREHVVD